MSDKKHQLMGYPFASDITVRLRIRDEGGTIISPDSGRVAIKVYLKSGTDEYKKPIKTEIAAIGQPIYQPWIEFLSEGSSPPYFRPVAIGDYLGYGLWKDDLVNIGPFFHNHLTQAARDKLASLGIEGVGYNAKGEPEYSIKRVEWLAIVATLNGEIDELTRQLAVLDPVSPAAATLRGLIEQKKAEKEHYFHGLTTVSEQDLLHPAQYSKGWYVLRIKRGRLRDLFGIERPEIFFIVLPINSMPVYVPSESVSYCDYFHPGTIYPSHPLNGWPFLADDGVYPGDHDIQLRPYYRHVVYGLYWR
ncbi:MAG: hypothetical protein H7834_09960 [Magnetococcus sp. YQC-9]